MEAGLAAVGDTAEAGVVTGSMGAVPGWGEGIEAGPVGVPPRLLCRGERGLCAAGDKAQDWNPQLRHTDSEQDRVTLMKTWVQCITVSKVL